MSNGTNQLPRYEFFATCSKGLESVLAYELKCICGRTNAGASAGAGGPGAAGAAGAVDAVGAAGAADAAGVDEADALGVGIGGTGADCRSATVSARELKALRIRPLSSGVAFFATLEQAYRALLGLFTASRVLLVLGRVDASDADILYKQISALPWEEHVLANGTLAVDAHGVNEALRDTRFVAQKVKDAICDRLLRLHGLRPSVQRNRPDLQVNISLRGKRATVALDLAGEPLHRRGYRVPSSAISAPLRETLAAAMLIIGGWYNGGWNMLGGKPAQSGGAGLRTAHSPDIKTDASSLEKPDASSSGKPDASSPGYPDAADNPRAVDCPPRYLLDPLCGSGTIAIEAALMAAGYAPGLQRDYWGFQGWLGHNAELWDGLLDEADEAAALGGERLRRQQPLIYASDIDAKAVAVAQESAKRAGVAGFIDFAVADVAGLELSQWQRLVPGLLACNPPYGERMFSSSQLPSLYAALAILRQSGTGDAGAWMADEGQACNDRVVSEAGEMPAVLITPDIRVDAYLGEASRCIETYNGPIETTIRAWAVPELAEPGRAKPRQAKPRQAKPESAADAAVTDADAAAEPAATPGVAPVATPDADDAAGSAATPGVASATAAPDEGAATPTAPQQPGDSGPFENRLRKMAAHRGKWARRTGVSCYRVYDGDLPDYAVAIDLYQGADGTADSGQRWLHIAEYKPPAEIDERRATERLAVVLRLAPKLLDVPLTNVFLKRRERSKGGEQYGLLTAAERLGDKANASTNRQAGGKHHQASAKDWRTNDKHHQASAKSAALRKGGRPVATPGSHLISEGGLLFEAEFTRLLDTGIFLDHRLTRSMLRERAAGLDCLNLFAYTGTASVYMAAGQARSVTTLDLSNNYLSWAQRNMQLNGFTGPCYDYQQADVLRWVEEHRHDSQKYGLIFVDPPTFSNSARMGKRSFDVQRDHVELVIALTRMLAPGGTVLFSCNLRGFKPDLPTLEKAKVHLEDISARSIPQDFERNQRIHHCFLATRMR